MTEIILPEKGMPKSQRQAAYLVFAQQITALGNQIGFKVSARGWCYQMENARLINKGDFSKVESVINKCRKNGLLPIDFTAEEDARKFSGVEMPEDETPIEYMKGYLKATLDCGDWYTPDWWEDEEYYIQMLVEKIDLKTLFEPVNREYHIPTATSKGWSSILQRGEYARRFKEAEEMGLKCVLLYCGDYDPDGLRIGESIRKNLHDVEDVVWEDDTEGYDPTNLEIDRFGLNLDFIEEHDLTWIDNLETGSGGEIARVVNGEIVQGKTKNGRPHKNFNMEYVQRYLKTVGVRKCEANAIVPMPQIARKLCRDVIEKYVGTDALDRFKAKRDVIKKEMKEFRERTGLEDAVNEAIRLIDEEEE